MPDIDLQQLVSGSNNVAKAINLLVTTLQAGIPQAGSTVAATATAGAAALPAAPAAFLTLTVGSTAYKIPLYNP